MARLVEFSRRFTKQLQKILTFYDERNDYLMGFTIIYRYNARRVTFLSIRSSARRPLKIYRRE